jgi:thiamine-monophosphate kinase
MSEFDLIQRYFTRVTPNAILGVGDDAALLKVSEGMVLAVSTDMLVSGTHFFPDADPLLLGHKALAVNLSDLAAMGATPRWATLSLSLPSVEEEWLEKFSRGFFSLADQYQVELIGGDTTRGPLNLCVTIMGEVPKAKALRRDGAKPGDDIWVSGALGEATLVLAHLQGKILLPQQIFEACAAHLHQPQPRVALGLALRGVANSAIDISDGLLADLGHILERSKVGAEIQFDALPCPVAMGKDELSALISDYSQEQNPLQLSLDRGRAKPAPPLTAKGSLRSSGEPTGVLLAGARGGWDGFWVNDVSELLQRCILAGGDDYELCFTAPAEYRAEIESISATLALPLTRIGKITTGSGCTLRAADGSMMQIKEMGYDHFA